MKNIIPKFNKQRKTAPIFEPIFFCFANIPERRIITGTISEINICERLIEKAVIKSHFELLVLTIWYLLSSKLEFNLFNILSQTSFNSLLLFTSTFVETNIAKVFVC